MPGQGACKPESARTPERIDTQRINNVSPMLTVFPALRKNAPAIIICLGGGDCAEIAGIVF